MAMQSTMFPVHLSIHTSLDLHIMSHLGRGGDEFVKVRVIDYRAVQNRSRFNLRTATIILHSPKKTGVAAIPLYTGPNRDTDNNKVELVASVGLRGVKGIGQIRFRIFRGNKEIFNTIQGIESKGSEKNYMVTFQAIDSRVSGRQAYILTAENMTPGTTVKIVGPVTFSGLSTRQSNS